MAGAGGVDGEAGEGEGGEGEEEGDQHAHQQPLQHGGGPWGCCGQGGEDEEDESCSCEKRGSLDQQLVERAAALRVDKPEGGTQRELKEEQGVVEQVDEEEGDDEQVGGAALPAQDDRQDEDGVQGDTGQDQHGEEDHPDQAGGGAGTGGLVGGGGADGEVEELEQLLGGGGHGHRVLHLPAFHRGDHRLEIELLQQGREGTSTSTGCRFKGFAQGGDQRQTGCSAQTCWCAVAEARPVRLEPVLHRCTRCD